MGRLTLVRHGQASFLSGDYDRLSPLGAEQARALAAHWLREGRQFDRIYTGTLRRQAGTAAIVGDAFRAAGAPWPDPVVIQGLDEFPAEELMRVLVPQLMRRDEQVRTLYAAYKAALGDEARHDAAFRLLEAVSARWIGGDCDTGALPTWDAFRARVRETLSAVLDGDAHDCEIVAFTSGGVIGVCLQSMMQSKDAETADAHAVVRETSDLVWRLHNCSLTELVLEDGRISLASCNAVPHLSPGMLTRR